MNLELHRVTMRAFLEALRRTRPQHIAVMALLRAKPLVTMTELIEGLYGDAPDGGSLWADDIVRQRIMELRRQGNHIENCYGAYRLRGVAA